MSATSSICSSSPSTPQITMNTGSSDNIEQQWNQYTSTNKTHMEWSELPLPVVPVTANGSSANYYYPETLSPNDFISPSSLSINSAYERNGMPNGIYTANGVRGLNPPIPNGPVIIRPIPHSNTNGWINQAATNSAQYAPRPTWISTSRTGTVRKQKRVRTAFNSQQMMDLEQEYSRNRYLDRTRRIELADSLQLNERTIKIWFQNRRMKEKKDRAEYLEEVEEVSTSESSPEIQMPVMQSQYATSYVNGVYSNGDYNQQYMVPPTLYGSTSMLQDEMLIPSTIPNQDNNYLTFIKDEQFEAEPCHIPTQRQEYTPDNNGTIQEIHKSSLPETEEGASQQNAEIGEQNWDLSWIRNIHSEDIF